MISPYIFSKFNFYIFPFSSQFSWPFQDGYLLPHKKKKHNLPQRPRSVSTSVVEASEPCGVGSVGLVESEFNRWVDEESFQRIGWLGFLLLGCFFDSCDCFGKVYIKYSICDVCRCMLIVLDVLLLGCFVYTYIPGPSSLGALHGSITGLSVHHPLGSKWHLFWKVHIYIYTYITYNIYIYIKCQETLLFSTP